MKYTFMMKTRAGKFESRWVEYLPYLPTRQDAIETRALVAARDIPVGDEIKEVQI